MVVGFRIKCLAKWLLSLLPCTYPSPCSSPTTPIPTIETGIAEFISRIALSQLRNIMARSKEFISNIHKPSPPRRPLHPTHPASPTQHPRRPLHPTHPTSPTQPLRLLPPLSLPPRWLPSLPLPSFLLPSLVPISEVLASCPQTVTFIKKHGNVCKSRKVKIEIKYKGKLH